MEDYYDITSHLDAREVLRYLNYMGIQNISGEVLKYFMTDLKKLIKYDLQQRSQSIGKYSVPEGPERLHTASTFSSRSRSKVFNGILCCTRECEQPRKPLRVRNVHSAPILGQNLPEKPPRRACSCVKIEKKTEIVKESSKTTTLCENLIKVPKAQPKKKCDPVSLYHYYSSLWEKYKPNVPGENDWADIRWKIRQKMVGIDSQPSSKVSINKDQQRTKVKKKIIAH